MPISKINTTSITDNSVTAGKIVAGAVDADIAAGSIDTAQIADDAVTTAKIPNDAVTADKLANAINTSIAAKAPIASPVFTGNVGIGATSPTVLLDLESASPIIRLTDSDASGTPECQISGAGGDLIFDADRDNEKASSLMLFKVDGAERMQIDGSGRVTMPYQPCFSATAATTNIPVATGTTVTLSSERFDVGNNLTNNIFTAPITGKYLFTYIFYIANLDAGHNTFDAHILTSNKQYQQTFKPSVFMNSDGNFGVSGSVIADMDINDTCRFNVYVSGGAAQTDIHADSHVSGCLLF